MSEPNEPLWASKKHLVYLLTLAALAVLVYLDAPEAVTSKMAEALAFGLPVLIAGQAVIDNTKAKSAGNVAVEQVKSGTSDLPRPKEEISR